jgi:hypothetical protein
MESRKFSLRSAMAFCGKRAAHMPRPGKHPAGPKKKRTNTEGRRSNRLRCAIAVTEQEVTWPVQIGQKPESTNL